MFFVGGGQTPDQAKVAYFDIAIGIEQYIRWFEIAMYELQLMNVMNCFEYLKDDVLLMVDCQDVVT